MKLTVIRPSTYVNFSILDLRDYITVLLTKYSFRGTTPKEITV
jgi:hypothetical protein